MSPEIRRITSEELPAFFDSMSTGFLERVDVDAIAAEVRPNWDLSRVWAAFDGDAMVGTFRSWATEVTVPGGRQLPAAAVTVVTVLPSHRRRGILRAMVAAEHAAIRERGEALALLYASEYPIYTRFGYGPGCRLATWTIDTRSTSFHGDRVGSVQLAKANPETRDIIRGLHDTWRRRWSGEIGRREYVWDYDLGLLESSWGTRWKGYVAIHRDPTGTIDGYARYAADQKWEQRQPRSVVKVDELHALSDDAYAELWRFLVEIDWVSTVKAENRSPSERLPWLLTNARAAEMSELGDGMWVRLFDVPRALEARTYERAGSLVLEIADTEAAGGRSRFLLEAGPDGATCRATDRSPDLTLDIAALGSAYLGGSRLRNAVIVSGVDEHRAGALDEADALFRTADEPWCSTFF